MTTFDLSPLWRSSVGFDEFDKLFDTVFSTNNKGASYPPYNISKLTTIIILSKWLLLGLTKMI